VLEELEGWLLVEKGRTEVVWQHERRPLQRGGFNQSGKIAPEDLTTTTHHPPPPPATNSQQQRTWSVSPACRGEVRLRWEARKRVARTARGQLSARL